MKHVAAVLWMSVAAASTASPVTPSRSVIESCLSTQSRGGVRTLPIATRVMFEDQDYEPGYVAYYHQFRGKDIGIAQRADRPDDDDIRDDALLYAGKRIPLKTAQKLVVKREDGLPRIDFRLSDWLMLEADSQRYLCVSSNFDGIGRSGAHQYVHFGYLLSLTGPKRLYWFRGDIRQRWRLR